MQHKGFASFGLDITRIPGEFFLPPSYQHYDHSSFSQQASRCSADPRTCSRDNGYWFVRRSCMHRWLLLYHTDLYRQGAMLAPIRLTNAGSCPSRQRDCVATAARSAETKGTAQLPCGSGETQGDASPPPVRTSPAPTRLSYEGSQISIR